MQATEAINTIMACREVRVLASITQDYSDYIPVKKMDMVNAIKDKPSQAGIGWSDVEIKVVVVREHGTTIAYVN